MFELIWHGYTSSKILYTIWHFSPMTCDTIKYSNSWTDTHGERCPYHQLHPNISMVLWYFTFFILQFTFEEVAQVVCLYINLCFFKCLFLGGAPSPSSSSFAHLIPPVLLLIKFRAQWKIINRQKKLPICRFEASSLFFKSTSPNWTTFFLKIEKWCFCILGETPSFAKDGSIQINLS